MYVYFPFLQNITIQTSWFYTHSNAGISYDNTGRESCENIYLGNWHVATVMVALHIASFSAQSTLKNVWNIVNECHLFLHSISIFLSQNAFLSTVNMLEYHYNRGSQHNEGL